MDPTELINQLQTITTTYHTPIEMTRVGILATILSIVNIVIGWTIKQPAFGGFLNELGAMQKKAVMGGIAIFSSAVTGWVAGMNWQSSILLGVMTVMGSEFGYQHGPKGIMRPKAKPAEPPTP